MKRAALILSLVIGLIVLAGVAIVLRPPAAMIGNKLTGAVREATGRDVVVKGATTVSLGWRTKVRMDDVTLANPTGVSGDPLLWARAIEVETGLMPALTGSRALDVVRLIEPRAAFTVDASGRNNWTFGAAAPAAIGVGAAPQGNAPAAGTAASARSLEIKGGSLSYRDARGKDVGTVDGIDGTASDVGSERIGAFAFTGAKAGVELSGTQGVLEAPVITGKSATPSAIAELDVKAGRLAMRGYGDGLDMSFDAPSIHATGLTPAKLEALVLKSATARAQLPDGATVTLDGAEAKAAALKLDEAGTLAITATAGRYVAPGGVDIALDGVAADGRAVSLEEIGALTLDGRALRYKLADGATGSLDAPHAEGNGITPDAIAGLKLKSTGLKHRTAAGTEIELAALDATGQALTRQSLGQGSLTAQTFATTEGDLRFVLNKIEATTKDAKLPGPLDVALAFDWNGERVAGNVKLDALALPTDGKPMPLGVRLANRNATLALDGTLSATREIEGKTAVSVKSVRDLAKWLGVELPKSGPLAGASVEGRIKASGKRLELADAVMALDQTKAKGALTIDVTGQRPRITGNLAGDRFDADVYGITEAPKQALAPEAATALTEALPEPRPVTLKDALKAYARGELANLDAPKPAEAAAAATKARAPSAPAWSDEPFDFSWLKKADVDLALSLDKLRMAGLDLGVPALKAKLEDGSLALDGRDIAIRGGKVTGRAALDARSGVPRAAANLKADNIEALDVFNTLGMTTMVAGKSVIQADIDGAVGSQKKLVESVSGSVKVRMAKGSIVGYDPGEILTYITGNGSYDPKRRWPFSRLDADMALDKGLSKSTKVNVDTSVAAASSDGTTNLPAREIDYQAKLNVSFWFQPILVHIFGAWTSPKWAADMFDASRGLAVASADTVRKLDLKDPELARLLGDLLAKSATSEKKLDPAVAETLRLLKAQAEAP